MGLWGSTPQDQTFDNPWRTVNWSDGEPMLRTLREFQSNHGVDHLRILVVGPAGAGKSAFITSVNTALQGRSTYLAHSLTGGSSVTSKYTVYKLNKRTEGSFFPFVFGDTMGLETGSNGAHTNNIINILHGHVPEGYTFDPLRELTAGSNDFNQTPNINDKVHCLVFVLPADRITQIPDEINSKLKEILKKARELGIPVVVIVSKVDEACPLVKQNLKMIYRSKKINEEMKECNVNLGVPLNYIFPVKNYHEEINNNAEIDILILMALTNIVNFANDFVERIL
ncbi:interferon-induced protein 44 [Ictalurus furcatus]|uniref:interferon-induced protein 44 n=1 Tax=Ictalurus furcatus TaxID=66913 RepID=UPI002350D3B8|nr:interferon-induced protein 44 [Ictalurus furcatus]